MTMRIASNERIRQPLPDGHPLTTTGGSSYSDDGSVLLGCTPRLSVSRALFDENSGVWAKHSFCRAGPQHQL